MCTPTYSKEARDTDLEIAATLAALQLDLKTVFPGRSEVWWIGHRKCMADTASMLFTSEQLIDLGVKMRISGKEAVLNDPTWPRFVKLLDYCKTKATTEVGR